MAVKYRLPITLAGVAVVLGLVGIAYFQNWVSVCALAVGFMARLAERILIPKKDPKLTELLQVAEALSQWTAGADARFDVLNDRLGKLELRNGMRS